ncbi:hypothetical protein [Salibacterium qingdaonense]|uniref:Uncharacterized protein n=1 Tax=Salibacterium qingdaonense TaxID=266892 RepID=A0A1I4QR05_9BACI|nr:hypothetical protein [Salibacterium qingdaonense]SFM42140.1 hypothetical protein SAMN04488054_1473 [Salibacterium qingdaonense]
MKNSVITTLVFGCLLLGSGCGQEDSGVEIQVYSDDVKRDWNAADMPTVPEDTKMLVYPSLVEKFVVEVAGHDGDIFIVEEPMLKAALDPEGLHSLQELEEGRGGAVFRKDQGMVYAVVVEEDASLLRQAEVSLSTPLIAVIPAYSDKKEQALHILKQALDQSNLLQKGGDGTWNSTG